MVVTDRRQAAWPLPELVAAAVAGGVRWVLLREKDLPRHERYALAGRLREVLAPVGGTLVVAGPDPLGGDAVHLSATDPAPADLPPDLPPHRSSIMEVLPRHAGDTPRKLHDHTRWVGLVGRSCHNPAEVAGLTTEDYLTGSPVFASGSKPGYGPVLGVAGLAGLVRLAGADPAGRAVLALGGVDTPDRAAACREAGADGVAVMGAVMRAADPAAVVADLLAAASGANSGATGWAG